MVPLEDPCHPPVLHLTQVVIAYWVSGWYVGEFSPLDDSCKMCRTWTWVSASTTSVHWPLGHHLPILDTSSLPPSYCVLSSISVLLPSHTHTHTHTKVFTLIPCHHCYRSSPFWKAGSVFTWVSLCHLMATCASSPLPLRSFLRISFHVFFSTILQNV